MATPDLEVVSKAIPIAEMEAAASVTEILERLLETSRSGTLVAVAIAGITNDRCSITAYHAGSHATMLLGAVCRLLRRVEEH